MKEKVHWGMIGCGEVTEKKSAPAFNLIDHSTLAGVTSRSLEKARAYAEQHQVPHVYQSVEAMLADHRIDAVYVATPPSSHAQYAIQAMKAGRAVYVEKPMAASFEECLKMNEVAEQCKLPLFVAYYRRSMEYFLKVRQLLEEDVVGKPMLCQSSLFLPPREADMDRQNLPWRVVPSISGGGYFHDMGCHELDILLFLFGDVRSVSGSAGNYGGLYPPEDTVMASIEFENGLLYQGAWCFVAPEDAQSDRVEIIGREGSLTFSCFAFTPIQVTGREGRSEYFISPPEHVQIPMIRSVVEELLGKNRCPSHGDTAARGSWLMERILGRRES